MNSSIRKNVVGATEGSSKVGNLSSSRVCAIKDSAMLTTSNSVIAVIDLGDFSQPGMCEAATRRPTDLDSNLILPYIKLAEYFCEKQIKSTFFLSIAPKSTGIAWSDYDRCLRTICHINQTSFSDYVRIQPHMHCLNLPLAYTKFDALGK